MSVFSHVLVACAAATLAIWVVNWSRQQAETPAQPPTISEQNSDSAAPTTTPADADPAPLASTDAGEQDADQSDTALPQQDDAPVKIVADPATLRVWHNTRVTLRAEPGEGHDFARYVWHFEDGSDPAHGEVVVHVFPESVGDRHVTLEAYKEAGEKLVVSRALPIERLDVVPLDGETMAVKTFPKARGTRLLMLGAVHGPWLAQVRDWIDKTKGVAAVVVTDEATGRQLIGRPATSVPILLWRVQASTTAAPTLRPLHDPDGRIKSLISGTARVPVVSGVALVAHDSTTDAHDEPNLQRTFRAMQAASAYDATLLLSARPLSPLVDNESIAESGFRLYEQALRMKMRAVVSATSEVAFDGRYGGLEAVSLGSLTQGRCRRLKGHDDCQSPTATVLDIPRLGRVRTLHLRGPKLSTWLSSAELPSEVGKYRR